VFTAPMKWACSCARWNSALDPMPIAQRAVSLAVRDLATQSENSVAFGGKADVTLTAQFGSK